MGQAHLNSIWGFFGSVKGIPSPSSISGAAKLTGAAGAHHFHLIPCPELVAQGQVAMPSGVQDWTMAATCQSRIYLASS